MSSINPINGANSYKGIIANNETKKEAIGKEKADKTDKIDISKSQEPITYNKTKGLGKAKVTKMAEDTKTSQLRDLVKKMLGAQSKNFTKSQGLDAMANDALKIKKLLSEGAEVDPATRMEAQNAISEGGMWSAQAVSDRLVDFAVSLSGGDPSKFETLKNAIQEGFRQAEEAWGGALPSICNDTYDLTMSKLEERFNVMKG